MTVTASSTEPAAGAAYPAVTRLDSLDLLRGLCALSVAIFHYHSWGGLHVPPSLEGFLAICGTYGVSVFFVLSGFSLAHGYGDRFGQAITVDVLLRYARRRIGRIVPLFAAVVLTSAAGKVVTGSNLPDIYVIAANLMLVFGFVDPAQTPVIGGWYVGTAIVFYAVFPMLLVSRRHMLAVLAVSIFLAAWISSSLGNAKTLDQGWLLYITPANHLILFAAGTYAGLYARDRTPLSDTVGLALAVAVLGIVALMSFQLDELSAVTGPRRPVLMLSSILLVITASCIRKPLISAFASLWGGASYPLYLIHPLIFIAASRILPANSYFFVLLLAGTVVLAVFIDLLVDKPLQRRIRAAGW